MRRPGIFVRPRILRRRRIPKINLFLPFLPSSAQFLDLNWACVQWCNVASPGGMCITSLFYRLSSPSLSLTFLTHVYRYYAAALPSILNVFTAQSYLILNCIIGGQSLAAVSNKLNDTLGIVIIALITFAVGF